MYRILIQRAERKAYSPTVTQLRNWVKTTLRLHIPAGEISIRIASIAEITDLNSRYRHKPAPTNVLAFPFDTTPELKLIPPLLGDIVACAAVIESEAQAQEKLLDHHWAHMMVHATLHLLGYDHQTDEDAAIMENKEILILQCFNINNPYQTNGTGI
jgi:probable rRNA maturation factor